MTSPSARRSSTAAHVFIAPDGTEQPLHTSDWRMTTQSRDLDAYVFRIPAHGETRPHDHLFHEIAFVEKGSADHQTAAGSQKLRPGDLIVLRPQLWHAYVRPRELSIVNCLITTRLIRQLWPFVSRVEGAFGLYRQRPRQPRTTPPVLLHASPAQREIIVQRLESVMAEQRERRNGWQDAVTAAILDLLVLIARLQGPSARPLQNQTPLANRTMQAVLDTVSFIETHYAESISLDRLAAAVHLSPGHLSRCFARQMGMGLVQYHHRMRAEEACRLLCRTDAPISEIAARVGYDEIAYFSRCFRNQLQQSPLQYRQAIKGDSGKHWQAEAGDLGRSARRERARRRHHA